jgi:hypothetical protein
MNEERAQAMFGTGLDTVQMIKAAHTSRADSEQLMELMSRLSDVQELIARDQAERARTEINIVKMLLNDRWMAARNAEIEAYAEAERQAELNTIVYLQKVED